MALADLRKDCVWLLAVTSVFCIATPSAAAQTCPGDEGKPCDGPDDDDLCTEGVVACAGAVATCISEGPLVYLPLDEGTGALAVNVGDEPNGGDATLSGVAWTTGKLGKALLWGGGSVVEWVRIPQAEAPHFSFSWGLWVRPKAIGGNYVISRTTDKSSNAMSYAVNGELFVFGTKYSTPALTALTWVHLAITYDGDALVVYHDGAPVFTQTGVVQVGAWNSDVWLGQEQDSPNGGFQAGQAYGGRMDEVTYHGYALSAAQVAQIYGVGVPTPERNRDLCDGLDNDCNPLTLDPDGAPCDGPDQDACKNGVFSCSAGGLLWSCGTESPEHIPEICNFIDDDCDLEVDEGLGVGGQCDGPDPDACDGGRNTCGGASTAICGVEPVVYYSFEPQAGGANTATDLTSWHHEAILQKGALIAATGKYGSGLQLDGVGAFARVYSSQRVRDTLNSATLAAWVRPSTATEGTLIYKLNGWQLHRRGDGAVAFTNLFEPTGLTPYYGQAPVDAWTHVAATVSGGVVTVFVNGVEVGSHSLAATPGDTSAESAAAVFLGCRGSGGWFCTGSFFEGRMDEVAIFDRALNSAEVALLVTEGEGWYLGGNEICGFGSIDGDCDGEVNESGSVGCSVFFKDADGDGYGSQTIVEMKPVAYWPMDELDAQGHVADWGGHGFALARTGGRRAPGRLGLGWEVDAWDPVVELRTVDGALQGSFLDLTKALSVSLWVKATKHGTVADGATLVTKDGAWELGISPAGALRLEVAGNLVAITGDGAVPVGQWSHIAVTYDESTVSFYVDGVAATSKAAPATIPSNDGAVVIGRTASFSNHTRRFDGTLDEVAIFGRVLTLAEVLTIRAADDHSCVCGADLANGYIVQQRGDCAPGDVAVHPGAGEVCDGADNDCNRISDDIAITACAPPSPMSACAEGISACAGASQTCTRRPLAHYRLNEQQPLIINHASDGRGAHSIGVSWSPTGKPAVSALLEAGGSITARAGSEFATGGGIGLWINLEGNPHTVDTTVVRMSTQLGAAPNPNALEVGIEGDVLYVRSGPGQIQVPAGLWIEQGVWTHLAVTWSASGGSGDLVTLYVDGRTAVVGLFDVTAADPYFLFGPAADHQALGLVDELVLYDYAPPSAVIAMLAGSGVPATQDTRELCDLTDNDCDGDVDEPYDAAWAPGPYTQGAACESADADSCSEGVWKCDDAKVHVWCDEGPLGYFDFENVVGTTAHDTGGDTGDAAINGATTAAGNPGAGLSFSGSTSLSHGKGLLKLRAATVMFWVKPSYDPASFASQKGLWTSGSGAGQARLVHEAPTSMLLQVGGAQNALRFDPTGLLAKDQWTHVALVWDASRDAAGVLIDGTLAAERSAMDWDLVDADPSATITLGATAAGGFQGVIDGYAIYRSPLGPVELASLYTGTPAAGLLNTEVCDSADNDCSGQADEVWPIGGACDGAGDADACQEGLRACTGLFAAGCPSDGPIAYYPLKSAADIEIVDESGSQLHAERIGGVTNAAGKYGTAQRFDGTDGRIRLPDSKQLEMTGGGQTLAAWIRPDTYASGMIIHKGGQWGLRRNASGGIGYANNAQAFCFTCNGSHGFTPAGDWSHVAAVWDRVTVTFYVNGLVVGSAPLSGSMSAQDSIALLGCNGGGVNGVDCVSGWFDGDIDEVALYPYALSSAQVSELAFDGLPASQHNALRCSQDAGCAGTPDTEGTLDCTTYWADGDADGAGGIAYKGFGAAAWWSFDALLGNTVRDLIGAADGGRVHAPSVRNGKRGRALMFDGTARNSHVFGSDSPALDLTDKLSLTAWVQVGAQNANTARRTIFAKRGAYELFVAADGRLGFLWPGLTGVRYGPNVPVGEWTFVAATWSAAGSSLTLYVVGASVQKSTHGGLPGPGNASAFGWGIGQYPLANDARVFDGRIDEVAIFAGELTETEVLAVKGDNGHACLCAPTGLLTAATPADCNDSVGTVFPGASEKCDGVDQNCNGQVDEGAAADADCDDSKSCTLDSCGGSGTCNHAVLPGSCLIGGTCYSAGAQKPADPCFVCDPPSSGTGWTARPEGTVCNDGDHCTENDVCSSGACAGTTVDCNDGNDCTTDSCAAASGCVHDPLTGGSYPCYTGDPATKGVGPCKAGTATCVAGALGTCVGQVTPASELCDSIDNDCDGSADENFSVGAACDSGDPDQCKTGTIQCVGTSSSDCKDDGPIVWVPFEEVTTLTTPNKSWGGKNVFLQSGPTQVGGPAGFGNALALDGVNDYIELQEYPDLIGEQDQLSVAMWVNRTAIGDHCLLCKRSASGSMEFMFGVVGERLVVQIGSQVFDSGIAWPSLNAWTHVAASYTRNGAVEFRVGGLHMRKMASGSASLVPSSGTSWTIGYTAATGFGYLKGGIDDVLIHEGSPEQNFLVLAMLPSREPCDGVDSNCDGTVDEGYSLGAGACDSPDMDLCANGTGSICHPTALRATCDGDSQATIVHGCEAIGASRIVPTDAGLEQGMVAIGNVTTGAGKLGDAMVFTGGSYLQTSADDTSPAEPLLGLYALWVRFDAVGDMALLSATGQDGSGRLVLSRKAGVLHVEAMGASKSYPKVTLAEGTWYHLALEVSGPVVIPYVAGVAQDGLVAPGTPMSAPDMAVTLGARWTGAAHTGFLIGAIDELHVFPYHPGTDALAALVTLGEACNGSDDDCDSQTDEGFEDLGQACVGGSTCVESGTLQCNASLTALECSGKFKKPGEICDDSDPCTHSDQCGGGGKCNGTGYVCDDSIPETTDTCDGDGTCTHSPNAGTCVIGATSWPEGTVNPANACQACITAESQSAWSSRSDGTLCSDGKNCTDNDQCTGGTCGGTTKVCDDSKVCTVDSCTELSGCVFDAAALEGTSCDDGEPCNEGTTCGSGVCGGGTAKDCDDNNPCTADVCNAATGCVQSVIAHVEACYNGPSGTKNVGVCKGGIRSCTGLVLGPCLGEVVPAAELCNTLDDNCNGQADEVFPTVGQACDGPDSDACENGTVTCKADGAGTECIGDLTQAEICDGKDNDCDGTVDNGFPTLGQPCDATFDADDCKEGVFGCDGAGGVTCVDDGPRLLLLGDDVGDALYEAADSSGTFASGAILKGYTGFGTGQRGGAFLLDGIDDSLEVPASPKTVLGTKFTLAIAFKLAAGSGSVSLIESAEGDCSDFALRINESGGPYALIEESKCGYASVSAGTTIVYGQWHHLALTADGTTYRLYLDGQLKQSTAQGTAPLETGAIGIGRHFAGVDQFFTGALEEVGLWQYALDAAQVLDLAQNGPTAANVNLEICDGADNDCNLAIDENATTELCDGRDNNCDGSVDEGFSAKGQTCDDGDADACVKGVVACQAGGAGTACSGDAPMLWWRFEEGTGTSALDASGIGHGTITGGTWLDPGSVGKAIKLNGAGSIAPPAGYVGADIVSSVAALTIEARARIVAGTVGTVIAKAGAWRLSIGTGNIVECEVDGVGGGGANVLVASGAVTTGTWHHLACVYDGGAVRLYVDAALKALVQTPAGAPILTGGAVLAGDQLNASLDDVAVWDGVLSEVRITAHSTTGIPLSNVTREICDTVDNDCNGSKDEGFEQVGQKCDTDDADTCANGTYACSLLGGLVCQNDDPANGVELCNGLDDDCDGDVDEDFADKGKACDGDDADICENGTYTCTSDASGLECTGDVTVAEVCDNVDNDCDGEIDEGFGVGDGCDGPDADQCDDGVLVCLPDGTGTECKGDGPIVTFPLDEGAGTTVDSPVPGIPNGTVIGDAEWVAGTPGTALRFDQVGEYVSVPDAPKMALSAQVSMGAWVKFDTASPTNTTIMRKGASAPNFEMAVSGSGVVSCVIAGLASKKCNTNTGLDFTEFQFVLCTWDGSAIVVYANGEVAKTCSAAGSPIANTAPLQIGAVTGPLQTPVTIDNISVWNRVVSPTEAASLYAGGDACDGVDNDCDGQIDEGFAGLGDGCDGPDADLCASGTLQCTADMLGTECVGDTNIVDVCDSADNDCDGVADEDFPTKGDACDGPDSDVCKNGTLVCTADGSGLECSGDTSQAEICDGLDNDCNGLIDDAIAGLGTACEGADADLCTDGVTFCDTAAKQVACDEVGALLWMRLDEVASATTAADASRFRRTMQAQSATFGVTGKNSTAASFAVPGRLVDQAGAATSPLGGLQGATWAGWVKHGGPWASGAGQTLVAAWGGAPSTSNQFAFRIVENGLELALRTTGDTNPTPTAYRCLPGVDGCTALVPVGTWTHVAAVFEGQEVRFFVGGVLTYVVPTVGASIVQNAGDDLLHVGADDGAGTNALKGAVDDVVVFGRALTEVELASLVANGPNGDEPEACNGKDDNCDTVIDEGFTLSGTCDGADPDLCTDGAPACAANGLTTLCDDSAAALHYTADDAAGARLRDVSGHGRDMILYGDATFSTDAKQGTGALKLVAATSPGHGKGPDVSLAGGQAKITWLAWVKTTTIAAGQAPILSTHGVPTSGKGRTWAVGRDGDGLFLRIRTALDNNAVPKTILCNSTNSCGALLEPDTWAHVAIVASSGVSRFYVNGQFIKAFPLLSATLSSKHAEERLRVGSDQAGELGVWSGSLDDIQMHQAALTATQVTEVFNQSQAQKLELCDGVDNDCDGTIDEEFPEKGLACDGVDSDLCTNGTWSCKADLSGLECVNETIMNIIESCNGLDDDCDSEIDETFADLGDACDSTDPDSCKEGARACNAAGTGTECVQDGPIGLWRLDEGFGTESYDTAGGLAPVELALSSTQWVDGKFGKALKFGGLVGNSASATLGVGGTRTIEFWVLPTNAGAPGYAYSQGTAGTSHFDGFWGSGAITHRQVDGGTLHVMSGPVDTGAWSHVAITMAPGVANGLKLYVNCVLQQQATLSANAAVGDFRLGMKAGSSQTFTGLIDELAVYDHTVPAATLCEHVAAGVPTGNENREICDAVDNDCDGTVDEGLAGVVGEACDGADADLCATGTWTCQTTRLDAECVNETESNKTEICNAADDDCDGDVDEGFESDGLAVGYPCDPPGECSLGVVECISTTAAGCSTGPGGSVSEVKPEFCDGKDNDCDAATDEKPNGDPVTENCYTGPAGTVNVGTCKFGQRQCVDGTFGACEGDITPAGPDDTCDGVNQDCDLEVDEDYSDGLACTVDSCAGGVASSVPDDSLCDDGNPCTDDACVGAAGDSNGCVFGVDNNNVPDPAVYGKDCKLALCQGGNIIYSTDDSSFGDDGLACTSDSCANGVAQHVILSGWCLIGGACYASGEADTDDGCKVCAPEFNKTDWSDVVHAADFDVGGGNVDGYTEVELANGGITWIPSPFRSVSGDYSYYFGNGSTLTYETGSRVASEAVSPKIRLPEGVVHQLTFFVWMETEGYTGSKQYDTLFVSVEDIDAGTTKQVWESMTTLNSNTDGVFVKVGIDLSAWATKQIQLRFRFDSGDSAFNDFEGVYLDSIRVETGCCLANIHCDDNIPCTADFCTNKQCVHTEVCTTCVRKQTTVAILVDKSESMLAPTKTGTSRWDATSAALQAVVGDFDSRVNLGAKLYPTTDASDECLVSAGLDLDFHSSVEELKDVLVAASPSGQTPMAAALEQAVEAFQTAGAQAQAGYKYVIVFTDGLETCSGDVSAQIKTLRALGVRTIVVAFDTTLTEPTLTAMALAGGLARPLSETNTKVYISAEDSTDVETALREAFELTVSEVCDGEDTNCNGATDDAVPAVACNLDCNGGLGGTRTCLNGVLTACSEQVNDEICDAKDNDCDGEIDEAWPDVGKVCSLGAGECFSIGKYVCPSLGSGEVICDAPAKSGSPEQCDSKDNDCDGVVDEELTRPCSTTCGTGTETCANGAYVDCDAVQPQDESCNLLDDDCNGVPDDIVPVPCTGACGPGFQVCSGGLLGGCSANGSPELCNGQDDDCDNLIDKDADGNDLSEVCNLVNPPGIGDCAVGIRVCSGGQFGECVPKQVPEPEICDGLDNDCDGQVDNTVDGEPVTLECYDAPAATKGVGECKAGVRTCQGDGTLSECVGAVLPGVEICDGLDSDCDGEVDENPGEICVIEPGCGSGACLCGKGDDGVYKCFLD